MAEAIYGMRQICTSPADLPPILRWAFWSSKNSLVAVRSETRFSSSAILFLSWWFSSWIWRKCPVDPSCMSEKSYHHMEGVRWGSPKNFWRTIHVSQAPGNLPYPRALIFSPSFHRTASSLKHATLLLLKIAPTAPSIAKWMRSSPWTGLEFTDTKNSPKVYRVTLHLIRVHFHVVLHGIHVSEPAPCFSCTFALVAEKLNRSMTRWVVPNFFSR